MSVTYCISATAGGVSATAGGVSSATAGGVRATTDAVSAVARRDCATGNRASPADLSKAWKREEKQSAVSRARQQERR